MINNLILMVFFCTGAAALVYEVLWTRYLTLMFGSTIQAQTVVLAVFMGGLALGNRWIGRRSDRIANPLLYYGCFEAATGLYAFCFPWLYAAADHLFIVAGSPILHNTGWLLVLKGALSIGLLLVPTVLMGGTLPLLSSWLARASQDPERWSARFYSTNSLGAVAGAWLAGFFLIRDWGLELSLQLAAFANLLAGIAVAALSRKQEDVPRAELNPTAQTGDNSPNTTLPAAACWTVALTGAVSMGLEVLSSRSLAMIVGGSLQAFAIVLMAFILGIGAGSAAVASPRIRRWPAERSIVFLLLASACWVGFIVLGIERWIDGYRLARLGLARNSTGFIYHQVLVGLMALFVLGVPAALNGAVLPIWIRALSGRSGELGRHVGRLLTWNTLGAVGGVLATGFILMPSVGLRSAFGLLAGLLCGGALYVAIKGKMKLAALACLIVIGGLMVAYTSGGQDWRYALSSGVFRLRETVFTPNLLREFKKNVKLIFYKDAADATVSVEQSYNSLSVKVNGKPDASSKLDLSTQLLIGHLPMAARPDAKEVFLLGVGSGITAGAVLKHPVNRLTIAENCRPMIEAARLFDEYNEGALTNARTQIVREDARTVLKLSPQTYDVIISEPSNPWTAGNGSVFSREFFNLASNRLRDHGIMVQWFHVYEMRDEIISLVLRTFADVFPHVEIWDTLDGDILLMGAKQPWRTDLASMRVLFERDGSKKDLARIGIDRPETLWVRQLASQDTAFAIPGDGSIQTDLFPSLDYLAPEAFYIGVNSTVLEQYDERTAQRVLASDAKIQSLAGLSVDDLKSVFMHYNSVNSSVRQYWMTCVKLKSQGFDADAGYDPNALPVIFRSSKAVASAVTYPDNCTDTLKTLLNARAALLASSESWKENVEAILANLPKLQTESPASADWKPAVFAATAVQVCIKQKDWATVEAVLRMALELRLPSEELGYLARIADRSKPLNFK